MYVCIYICNAYLYKYIYDDIIVFALYLNVALGVGGLINNDRVSFNIMVVIMI